MSLRSGIRVMVPTILLLLTIVACQGPTRTEFVIEMTREVTVVVVVTATPEDQVTDVNSPPVATPMNTATEMPEMTATPDIFPTPVVAEIIVAEQQFERGQMFYVQPIGEIWVLYNDPNGLGGVWERHEDNWQEGMAELDPDITPPEGLAQPIRGFGLLWRSNEAVKNGLGWAIEPEAGHVTTYRYEAGGEIVDGEYRTGPGVHLINSRNLGTTYMFDEAAGRWSLAATPSSN